MFIKKQELENILQRLASIESKEDNKKEYDFVVCSTCGCTLQRKDAYKGVGELRQRPDGQLMEFPYSFFRMEDYVHYDWFCKAHYGVVDWEDAVKAYAEEVRVYADKMREDLGLLIKDIHCDDQKPETPEQKARDLLERMEVPGAQDYTAGELVELANLFTK